jgi:SAM-dependent methyltransferase
MHLDVVDLRNFYYRTRLGRAAQKAVRDQLVALWPPRPGETVAGFGFAVPLLRPYLQSARRVIGLMPGPQGVMPWPAGMPNVSVLCEETAWPLPNASVDRLVLMHGLETSENPSAVLEEAARVLAPEGRLMVIVPNRAGLWSRADRTPFGFGRPYSAGQLEAQLQRHGFVAERTLSALFVPPQERRFWMRMADFWERHGRHLMPWRAGGVIMVEATRQVWAPTRGGLGAVVRAPFRVLEGAARPVAEPGRARNGEGADPAL